MSAHRNRCVRCQKQRNTSVRSMAPPVCYMELLKSYIVLTIRYMKMHVKLLKNINSKNNYKMYILQAVIHFLFQFPNN